MGLFLVFLMGFVGCATLPEPHYEKHSFPKEASIGKPDRPFESLGVVKARVDFNTLDAHHDEAVLCRNYFNAAVKKLVDYARAKGADAVTDVRSVVFTMDGRSESFPRAECSDDGTMGQVLAQGLAVKWKSGTAVNNVAQ